jgi:hypothetical protein
MAPQHAAWSRPPRACPDATPRAAGRPTRGSEHLLRLLRWHRARGGRRLIHRRRAAKPRLVRLALNVAGPPGTAHTARALTWQCREASNLHHRHHIRLRVHQLWLRRQPTRASDSIATLRSELVAACTPEPIVWLLSHSS